jgi:hypothetical protein
MALWENRRSKIRLHELVTAYTGEVYWKFSIHLLWYQRKSEEREPHQDGGGHRV